VDLLLLDDFAIDTMDPVESRDLYEILLELSHQLHDRHLQSRTGRMAGHVCRSGAGAERAIDRFTSNAYDLVIEGESYRPRLKPKLPKQERPL
jgi:DNA replication protein DnaC